VEMFEELPSTLNETARLALSEFFHFFDLKMLKQLTFAR